MKISTTQENSKFRFDINALRAIAILGVLLFHYKVEGFAGGFAGVDIFFVISGYLMSKIIITGIDNNKFSFRDFYGKRLKRIVPALLFLIIILSLVGFFIYFPGDYQLNEKNASASLLFLSNVLYLKNSNYFDAASESNILLHTWSLSVEWQFYLIYPVILIVFNKLFKKRNIYLLVFSSTTIIIYIASVFFSKHYPTASFYLLPTRAWEMMFGGIALLTEDAFKKLKYISALTIVGYIIMFLSLFFLKNEMLWPGIFTLIPVLATFLVIVGNQNSFSILKNGVIQFLGKVSYSLYLWHWPIFVIAQYMGIKFGGINIALMTIVSILIAYLSYRYIEAVRFEKSRRILAYSLITLGFTISLTYFKFNKVIFKPQALKLANYKVDHSVQLDEQFDSGGCFITSGNSSASDFDKQRCLKIEQGRRNILLIGDSHAADLSMSLREAFKNRNVNLIEAAASGCYPILRNKRGSRCSDLINYVYNDFILNNSKKIDAVILSANWFSTGKNNQNLLLDEIVETVDFLKKLGLKVIIIGQNETYSIPYASIVAKELEYNINLRDNYLNKDSFLMNEFLKVKLKPYYVDIYNTSLFPKLSDHNEPYMFDENHFTKYGADLAVKKVLSNSMVSDFLGADNYVK